MSATFHNSTPINRGYATDMQREKAAAPLLPLDKEFTGRQKLASWAAVLTVSLIFWTAFFALVFS